MILFCNPYWRERDCLLGAIIDAIETDHTSGWVDAMGSRVYTFALAFMGTQTTRISLFGVDFNFHRSETAHLAQNSSYGAE